jgi:hypothetical protein
VAYSATSGKNNNDEGENDCKVGETDGRRRHDRTPPDMRMNREDTSLWSFTHQNETRASLTISQVNSIELYFAMEIRKEGRKELCIHVQLKIRIVFSDK